MDKIVLYVFLDSRTEDAAITLDPIKYQGRDGWYQVGEAGTLTELKELLSSEPFDPGYWDLLLEELSEDILKMLIE